MSTEQELAAVAEASYEAEAMEFCEIDKAFNRDKMMSDMRAVLEAAMQEG